MNDISILINSQNDTKKGPHEAALILLSYNAVITTDEPSSLSNYNLPILVDKNKFR